MLVQQARPEASHARLVQQPEPAPRAGSFDDSTVANGCMRFLPGSNKESTLRKHAPVRISKGRMDEESSHALATTLSPADEAAVRTVEIKRGDITVHDQRVVHGSGPNNSEGWRRAYVLAFRSDETIAIERRLGFTHSHNDDPEVLDAVGDG